MGFLRFSRGAKARRDVRKERSAGRLRSCAPRPSPGRAAGQEGFRIPPPWALPVCTGEVVGAAAVRRRTVSR